MAYTFRLPNIINKRKTNIVIILLDQVYLQQFS